MKKELSRIVSSVKAYIEYEKAFGHHECPVKDAPQRVVASTSLQILQAEVSLCKKCPLHKTRTNVVFGAGSPRARLMFVGEAPGEDEDIQGLPFVGRAGQLLTKIIQAMGFTRDDVYIANILKCRPPHNRAPLPEEIAACSGYVKSQIELIKPKALCTLGKFASQTLLGTETPISALRGRFHDCQGIPVMPTYHPAYLLRNPAEKKAVWEDMQKIMKVL